jgi:hypothetical protein
MGSGQVLTTTKCMAPKAAWLHHCRSPSDRLRARRAGQMGRRWRMGTERPEIDARMKSINDLQTMRIQTRTLQREELGYVQSDEVLILAVSVSVERCISAQYGQNSRSYAGSHAPRVLRDCQRIGKPKDRSMSAPRAPRRRRLPRLRALCGQDRGSSTPNCWELFDACKRRHGGCGR